MDENESITKELRAYVSHCISNFAVWPDPMSDRKPGEWVTRDGILGKLYRIDERFTHELEAKQAEIDALKSDNADLQARLYSSIPLPVDADGVVWHIADEVRNICDGRPLRVVAIGWEKGRATIVYVDPADEGTLYSGRADKCRHVAPEPPDSQERIDADAKKGACTYFGRPGLKSCDGCPAYGGNSCTRTQFIDLLRRQRELDGRGEQA